MAVLAIDDMVERKKIDFREPDRRSWLEAIDQLALKATPQIFEWLKWVIILVALQAAANKTNDALIQFIVNLLYIYLFFYVNALCYSVEFHGFPLIKSERVRRIISIIISGLLAYGLYYALTHLSAVLIAGTITR